MRTQPGQCPSFLLDLNVECRSISPAGGQGLSGNGANRETVSWDGMKEKLGTDDID